MKNEILPSSLLSKSSYLIYTDLDGTLLDHKTYCFKDAKPTLKKLVDNGHIIIPNTSKTYAEVTTFRNVTNLNTPFIFENGAAVAIPKTYISCQPTGTEDIGDMWLKSFTKKRNHWLKLISDHGQPYADKFTGFSTMSATALATVTGLTIAEARRAMQRQYGEPLHWFGDVDSKNEFMTVMKNVGANILQGGRFIHVGGEIDKGQAMLWLTSVFRQHYQQLTFKSIALGDSSNDVAMLESADIAVLIKSPSHKFPNVMKTKHLYRSKRCGPAGWSECLEKIIFNRE